MAVFSWRHAADLGLVQLKYAWVSPLDPFDIAALEPAPFVWQKGDRYDSGTNGMKRTMYSLATRPGKTWPIAGPNRAWVREDLRLEWILIGTTLQPGW